MITIKTKEEIEILKKGGKILAEILKKMIKEVKPGANTGDLEDMACQLIKKAGSRPAFKNYEIFSDKYFPTALCTSINNEVVHAPSLPGRVLKEGDIISLDLGMEYPTSAKEKKKTKVRNSHSRLGGFYTDMAKTVAVGRVDKKIKHFLDITKKSLELAIKEVKPGNTLNDIGKAIQREVEGHGFSVVRDLVGHGVGHKVHEEPQVFNYEFVSLGIEDIVLKPGMVIAIEPMANMGSFGTEVGPDGFSVVTADNSLNAHFEHTVAVTKKGNIVLTKI